MKMYRLTAVQRIEIVETYYKNGESSVAKILKF